VFQKIWVADAREGQPLAESVPYQLIVTEDRRPARLVRNLNSMTLQGVR
jgi:hypothetical protein